MRHLERDPPWWVTGTQLAGSDVRGAARRHPRSTRTRRKRCSTCSVWCTRAPGAAAPLPPFCGAGAAPSWQCPGRSPTPSRSCHRLARAIFPTRPALDDDGVACGVLYGQQVLSFSGSQIPFHFSAFFPSSVSPEWSCVGHFPPVYSRCRMFTNLAAVGLPAGVYGAAPCGRRSRARKPTLKVSEA